MKKVNKTLILIIGIFIGLLISAVVGYAATILFNSNEVGYNNTNSGMLSTDVQGAIDELYSFALSKACKDNWVKKNETSDSYECVPPPICKRATTLHTATCSSGTNCCYAAGYYVGGSKNTTTITYGNLWDGTSALTRGDALDCDVNGDGTYDSTTERFYYVTSNGSGDNEKAVLIYYGNISNDGTNITVPVQTNYAYDSSGENWHGPRTAATKLPTTTQWSNSQIIAPAANRQITNQSGGTTTSGGTIQPFTYGKAARLLTYQEVQAACGSSITSQGNLDNCTYLMENVGQFESRSGTYGYWLEMPYASDSFRGWVVSGRNRYVTDYTISNSSDYGVRPVIEVLKSNISGDA